MAKTGLAFYRKPQSLSEMQLQRPKSLDELHRAVLKATTDVEGKLTALEKLFYDGRRPEDELREILPHIREVMVACQVTYIHAAYQINEMINIGNNPNELFKANQRSFAILSNYHRKLIEFVPGRLQDVLEEMELITEILERYCLSFYKKSDSEPYLETAEHYERKRADFKAAIEMHVSNIPRMGRMYRDKCGLPVKVFGMRANELARACDCGDIPMLLVFPEACQNIRNACKGVRKWVTEDEMYGHFIHSDIRSLEAGKAIKSKHLRDIQEKTFQLEHKHRAVTKQIHELELDLERLQHRDKQLNEEVSRLENDIKYMEIDIELKEQERERLREKSTFSDEKDSAVEKIAAQISELRYQIPAAKKQIAATRDKMSFLLQRHHQLRTSKVTLADVTRDLKKAKSESTEATTEMTRIDRCIAQLREIHKHKTAADVPKKIFYHMPITTQHGTNQKMADGKTKVRPRRDNLDKASQVVANEIHGSWPVLYRKLPFYPARGERILDEDVDQVTRVQYRSPEKVKATDSLQRWRRMHTRANIVELKGTLKEMGRADIVDKIEDALKPKVKVKPKGKEVFWYRYRNLKLAIRKLDLPSQRKATPLSLLGAVTASTSNSAMENPEARKDTMDTVPPAEKWGIKKARLGGTDEAVARSSRQRNVFSPRRSTQRLPKITA